VLHKNQDPLQRWPLEAKNQSWTITSILNNLRYLKKEGPFQSLRSSVKNQSWTIILSRVWSVTIEGFGFMTQFIVYLDTARGYILQFTIMHTPVSSHVFTAVAC
jgi:hypothetical protein